MGEVTTEALNAHHRAELERESAIDPAVIQEREYATVGRPNASLLDGYGRNTREALQAQGFPSWAIREDYYFPGLVIPNWTVTGQKTAGQWKPFRAVPNRQGKPQRYTSAKGNIRLDVHPRWTLGGGVLPPILDSERRLWITEGVKKADSLTSRGEVTIGLSGVYNWRSAIGPLGDWESVTLKERVIFLCFDSDARSKPQVMDAMKRLGRWLKSRGASKVWYVLPTEGKGVDDHFAAGGTLKDLEQAASLKPPTAQSQEDPFTDSALAEQVADLVLDGRYCRTAGLGWMRWNGMRWATAEAGEVTEAIRQHFREEYANSLTDEADAVRNNETPDTSATEGWRKAQSAGKISAVLSLAANMGGVLRETTEFDVDPDILNTPTGVVHLPTLDVREHSPDLMCTKITAVGYRPEAHSNTLKNALEAVPVEALDWFQLWLGQALTGHTVDRLLLLTGGGSNGKTVLMGAAFRVLGGGTGGGGYAAKVPNALLLKGKQQGGATPEKMTLRGTRLAYMEETPEEGYLDANVAKEIIDAEVIEGRHLYKDTVEWTPTHTVFLNTNHPPIVTSTDDATWRRLCRLDFPLRFRKPHEPLERDTDRHGDPKLKAAMGKREAQEAFLAWMVAGAHRWYQEGHGPDPVVAEAALGRWREACDDVLRFISSEMRVDQGGWVVSSELYEGYKAWALANGQRAMSAKEWGKRLAGHSFLPSFVEAKVIKASRDGVSRPPAGWSGASPALKTTVRAHLGLVWGDGPTSSDLEE